MSDPVAELTKILREAGIRPTLDLARNVTLCAICGRRAPFVPRHAVEWRVKLPWLGPCRRACSERCERIAIESRDAP